MLYVLHVLHIIVSSEQEAVSGDFGLIIVVVMAILLTLIGSLVVFILRKQFNRKPMEGFRFCVRGRDITQFIIRVILGF